MRLMSLGEHWRCFILNIGSFNNKVRAAQQIKFAKMPIRHRSGSSPIRSSVTKSVEVLVTSPSRRSGDGRLRRGSLGTVEAMKQRARRDTTTSSEISSENELDPSVFKRREIGTMGNVKSKPHEVDADYKRSSQVLANLNYHGFTSAVPQDFATHDDAHDLLSDVGALGEASAEDSTADSGTSYLGEVDSGSLLDGMNPLNTSITSARPTLAIETAPKKLKSPPSSLLQAPIQKRPISTVQPQSILGQLIKAQKSTPKNPLEIFQRLFGKGVPNPLYIRIYAFFSNSPNQPIEMPLQRTVQDSKSDNESAVTVADAIGLSLWRYNEERYQPSIDPSKLNVNRWMLRFIDDGQPELDSFPLVRTQAISNFTFNNNSNRGYRARSKEKSYDDFALVEATEAEYEAHRLETPKYDQLFAATQEGAQREPQPEPSSVDMQKTSLRTPERPPTVRKLTAAPADVPNIPTSHSTPRMGPLKTLKIHYQSPDAYSHTTSVQRPTDTYLAEVLDIVCKKWNLDKAYHFLKVSGTTIKAVNDRTIESMGKYTDLDLERSHFAGGSLALSGSPASSSPNAPLFLQGPNPPRRVGRRPAPAHPLAQMQDLPGDMGTSKRYTVQRKQPISFTSHHQYTLILGNDYIQAVPAEAARALSSEKTRKFPIRDTIGCEQSSRHPKQFKVNKMRVP